MIPSDIDRDAPVIVKRDRVIEAPIEPLRALHLDIAQWPAWQKNIVTASLDGPLVVGKSFTWSTAGLDTPIVSTIYAIEPQRATLWGGPSAGSSVSIAGCSRPLERARA